MRLKTIASSLVFAALLGAGDRVSTQPPGPDSASGAVTLPAVIPIFPLEDATLFPNASRPFHIFEPRYRAMVADALEGDRVIGMVTLRPGHEADYDGRPPVFAIGCAGVIADVETLPDGRFNILLRGLVKFRVDSEEPGRPYRLARVSAIREPSSVEDRAALGLLRGRLENFVTTPGGGPGVPRTMRDEEVIDTMAQYVPLDPPDRQGLLELEGALGRAQALLDLLASPARPAR